METIAVSDVERAPPEDSHKISKILLGAAFTAGDTGFTLACAIFSSIVGYEIRDTFFKQQLRNRMDHGFQCFCDCIDARDLLGASEQYEYFTDRESLNSKDRVGLWAIEYWSDGASNVLRIAVLRGILKEKDVARHFPRCHRIHTIFDDARLIIGAIEGIDDEPTSKAKLRYFISELQRTEEGIMALDIIARHSKPFLEHYYTSMLDRYKWRVINE